MYYIVIPPYSSTHLPNIFEEKVLKNLCPWITTKKSENVLAIHQETEINNISKYYSCTEFVATCISKLEIKAHIPRYVSAFVFNVNYV